MYFAYRCMGRTDELQAMIGGARSAAASWKDPKLKAQFFSSIAMCAMELGQLDMALSLADTGVMMKPDLPAAYGYRSFIKRMRGNAAGAEEDCDRCAEIELTPR
jgi:hypothetical protein